MSRLRAVSATVSTPSLLKSVTGCLNACFQQLPPTESLVHLHACQVLVTPSSHYSGQDIQSLPELLQDELEGMLPIQKAIHADRLNYGSMNLDGADLQRLRTPTSYTGSLTAFGGVVDRLAFVDASQRLKLYHGVHATLYYSVYSPSDLSSDVALDALSFYLPSSRQRLSKSVGRWPGSQGDTRDTGLGQETSMGWQLSGWRQRMQSEGQPAVGSGGFVESHTKRFVNGGCVRMAEFTVLRRSFFVLSDNEPYQALRLLNRTFPHGHISGIIGGWTPFLTGHPFSLFFNDMHRHGGMVGIGYRAPNGAPDSMMLHSGLEILGTGSSHEITKCQGNIIMQLDGKNPVEVLKKELLGKAAPDAWPAMFVVLNAGERHQHVRQLSGSGSPTSGLLSVELNGSHDLQLGQRLQFAVKPQAHGPSAGLKITSDAQLVIGNLAELSSKDGAESFFAAEEPQATGSLGVSSETGYIFSRETEQQTPDGAAYISDVQTSPGSYLIQ